MVASVEDMRQLVELARAVLGVAEQSTFPEALHVVGVTQHRDWHSSGLVHCMLLLAAVCFEREREKERVHESASE